MLGSAGWDALFGGSKEAGGALGREDGARLVLVTLYGGNDGLNTVIPYQDPAYAVARGPLAIAPSAVLPIGEGFGLHPGMPGFKTLWDERQLAVVHGVGFADPDYSHFQSMDIWQSGVPGTPVTTGWLGRWLDGTRSSPLRALALGPTVPQLLTGSRVQGAAIPVGPLVLPGSDREQTLFAALARRESSEPTWVAQAAASDRVLLELHERLGPALAGTETSDPLHLSSADTAAKKNTAGALAIADGGGGAARRTRTSWPCSSAWWPT